MSSKILSRYTNCKKNSLVSIFGERTLKSCRSRVLCSERLRKHGKFPYLKKNGAGKDAEVALTNALKGLRLSRSRLWRPRSPYVEL